MNGLRSHLAPALESLRRTPGLTASIILMLAVGVGMGVSVVGMIRSGLARPASCIDPLLCGLDGSPDFLLHWTAERQLLPDVQADGLRTLLWIASGLTLLLLATILVNVLSLVLARSASRRSAIAMRTALGAVPGRVAVASLVQGSLLVLSGAGLGALLGIGGSLLLRVSWPLEQAPWEPRLLEGAVLAALVGITGSALLLAWTAPVRVAWSPHLRRFLAAGGRVTPGPAEMWMRHALAICQIAASLILLTSAGLLLLSFAGSGGGDRAAPFEPGAVLAAQLQLPEPGERDADRRARYYEALLQRVRAVPGVLDTSVATNGAWAGLGATDRVAALCLECGIGSLPKQLTREPARIHAVSPGHFGMVGVEILRGRGLQRQDRSGSSRVSVVSEAFAHRLFPNGDPIGKEIQIGGHAGDWYRVVGVVGDVLAEGLGRGAIPFPTVYLSLLQHPPGAALLMVRTAAHPMSLEVPVRAVAEAVAPGARVSYATTMERLRVRHRAPLGWFAMLFGVLAATLVIFTTFGLYGSMAHQVAKRRREIGVRMALGACRENVMRLILGQSLRQTLLGGVFGLIPLSGVVRLLQMTFCGVDPWEPALYGGIVIVLGAVALTASYGPATSATSVQPRIALRDD